MLKRVFMKKLVLLFAISILISSCGVQRPYAPTISLINGGDAALPFASQQGMSVQTYSLYNVRLDWNVTNTGAQGVKILAAKGDDYYCDNPIAAVSYYVTDTSTITNTALDTLGYVFQNSINKFVPGNRYAFCICSVLYDRVSQPSWPVFVDLLNSSGGLGMGYYF